jgi:hypothetical protein
VIKRNEVYHVSIKIQIFSKPLKEEQVVPLNVGGQQAQNHEIRDQAEGEYMN